jgi:hypothetical protein
MVASASFVTASIVAAAITILVRAWIPLILAFFSFRYSLLEIHGVKE